MYLVDTNVWLERLLDQKSSETVGRFLDAIPSDRLCMTDFAFHSIAVILTRLKRTQALLRLAQDSFVDGAVALISLRREDTRRLVQAIEQFNLDFDDAYQYVAAEKHNLTIVSFDSDFDRTERGRKTPAEILPA
ncbi:twitching motility protein PilT [candidate division BRC1 bacterium SM23_51]|nr:MAG: twitching motility protein PilT [candidate division BRC1 bacterium SM23_51]